MYALRFSRQHFAAVMGSVLLSGCVANEPLVRSLDPHAPTYLSDRNVTRLMYALPTAKVPLTIKGTEKGEVTMEVGAPKYFPDPSHHYIVEYTHNEFSDDTFSIETDASTLLLKKVATISKDKTSEIVPLITSTLQEFKKAQTAFMTKILKEEEAKEEKYKPFTIKRDIDPATDGPWLKDQMSHLKDLGWKLDINVGAPPIIINGKTVATSGEEAPRGDCMEGICFRVPRPYVITLENKIGTRIDVLEASVLLPNRGMIGAIDFRRHAFVENKVTAEFDNGMLKKLELNDPSEIAGFLKLPSSLIQLVVAGATLGG